MGELLLRKLLQCRSRLAKIRAALPARPEDVLTDDRLESHISFNIFLLAQDCVDLAAHLVAERGLGIPDSQRDAFDLLAKAGLVSDESAADLARIASLRNRIAHAYGDIDAVRLVREAPAGLEQVARFLDQLAGLAAA